MEDRQIVELYWTRDQGAITATEEKYGAYCGAIAGNILGSAEDAEECVNDTWLRAWNAMPPERPRVLSAYLGRITRNLSLNRLTKLRAEKRGGGQAAVALEELGDLVSDRETPEAALDRRELVRAIDGFLGTLPKARREFFLRRYWYFDSVPALASRFGMTENNVSVTLSRLRCALRDYLTERGFVL